MGSNGVGTRKYMVYWCDLSSARNARGEEREREKRWRKDGEGVLESVGERNLEMSASVRSEHNTPLQFRFFLFDFLCLFSLQPILYRVFHLNEISAFYMHVHVRTLFLDTI